MKVKKLSLKRLLLLSALALFVSLPVLHGVAAQNQPQSAVPEVPAGANPQPNGNPGNNANNNGPPGWQGNNGPPGPQGNTGPPGPQGN